MPQFEKYLTIWVFLCIVLGIIIGVLLPDTVALIDQFQFGKINGVITIFIWGMIFPMMLKIDFSSIKNSFKTSSWKGYALTLFINWLIKPFSMALLAYIFFKLIYAGVLSEELSDEYIAGAILLGAAPCTAMVFVWSYLSKGDANFTVIQVTINDILVVLLYIPIVGFLLNTTAIAIPYDTLLLAIILFVIVPILFAYVTKLMAKDKIDSLLNTFRPISIAFLLLTLILIFSLQAEKIIENPFDIALIAIPLTIQTYFVFFLAWFIGKAIKTEYKFCAPASLIGASNFFELAVAVAIALFGFQSGATLATVVGVLIEVPIMLSLVAFTNKSKY